MMQSQRLFLAFHFKPFYLSGVVPTNKSGAGSSVTPADH